MKNETVIVAAFYNGPGRFIVTLFRSIINARLIKAFFFAVHLFSQSLYRLLKYSRVYVVPLFTRDILWTLLYV